MKVIAHLVVSKGYALAITASQWIDELREHCDEHNEEEHGEGWRSCEQDRAVVSVEFEVPDSVFAPMPPPPVLEGKRLEGGAEK